MDINQQLAEEFKIRKEQVDNTVKLIDDGNTIPFIARYRKEVTGALDDQLLRELDERLAYLRNLEQRKTEVKEAIEAGGNLTEAIESCGLYSGTDPCQSPKGSGKLYQRGKRGKYRRRCHSRRLRHYCRNDFR